MMTKEQQEVIYFYYISYHKDLLKYARSLTQNNDLAEEVVQDAFSIACEKVDALTHSLNPRGWLTIVVRNVVFNRRRNRTAHERLMAKLHTLYMEDCLTVEDLLSVKTLWEDISQTQEYQFLKHFIVDNMTTLEVAKMYNLTVGSCRSRKCRAAKQLREIILKKYEI